MPKDVDARRGGVAPARTATPGPDTLPPQYSQAGQTPKLDATKAIRLVLRDVAHATERATRADSAARETEILKVASDQEKAFLEAVAIAGVGEVDWAALARELDLAARAYHAAHANLSRFAHLEILSRVSAGWQQLVARVDPRQWKPGAAKSGAIPAAKAVAGSERFAMGEQAIAAALVEADRFITARPEKSVAAAHCVALRSHVEKARDSMGGLSKSEHYQFRGRVVDLSARLEHVNAYLAAAPKAPWDRTFAALFDSEHALRKIVGWSARADRAYSGTVSPEDALKHVRESDAARQSGSAVAPPKTEITDPQHAVTAIGIELAALYDRKLDALDDVGQNLDEVVAEETSWFDSFMMIAANLMLGATTTMLGNLLGKGLRAAVDGGEKRRVTQRSATELAKEPDSDKRQQTIDQLMEGSSLRRSLQVDLSKDLLMTVLFKGQQLGVRATPPPSASAKSGTHALTLKNQFFQLSRAATQSTKYATLGAANALAASLAQLDLDVLAKFASAVADLQQPAYEAMYEQALVQWQNAKARAASPGRGPLFLPSATPALAGDAKAHGETSIPGVIEFGMYAGPNAAPTLDYVVLRDGEDAAVAYFRKHPRAIKDLDVHRMYQINFTPRSFARRAANADYEQVRGEAPSVFVKFGVPRGGKVQAASFTAGELDAMRMYAFGLDPHHYLANKVMKEASSAHAYRTVSDADAIAAALKLAAIGDTISTAMLRKG